MTVFPATAVAIFCDDIREEVGGMHTIVGTIPDNVEVPSVPGMMPKIAVYFRMTFDPHKPIKSASMFIRWKDDNIIASQEINPDSILTSASDTLSNGTPMATILTRIMAAPFPVPRANQLQACATINGDEYIVATINFRVAEGG